MTNIPRTAARGLVKLILTGLLVQLLMLGYVFYQSYEGRVDIVENNRAACMRGKLDRRGNAIGWRTEEAAKLKNLAKDLEVSYARAQSMERSKPKPDDPPELVAARKYNAIAAGQEKRSRLDCSEAFPKASLIP